MGLVRGKRPIVESSSPEVSESEKESEEDVKPVKKAKVVAKAKPGPTPQAETPSGSTPLNELKKAIKALERVEEGKVDKDGVVVYWMRNKDLRILDNVALSAASKYALLHSLPILIMHLFSPGDYRSHHRSARRIDFQLRQLAVLKAQLDKINVPLYTTTLEERKTVPDRVMEILEELKCQAIFGNIEYEVDELRRDTLLLKKVKENREKKEGWRGKLEFREDLCVVHPNLVLTKTGTPYAMYSPWYKNWSTLLSTSAGHAKYIADQGTVSPNPPSARSHPKLAAIFGQTLPGAIKGFELTEEDGENMRKLWPVEEGVCDKILHRFLKTKIRPQMFQEPPLNEGSSEVGVKESKIGVYGTGRNRVDQDGTSHISAYLTAGLISSRACLRQSIEVTPGKSGRLQSDKSDGGIGVWVSEIAWRDFYIHVLAAWPRVCMNRPFNLKFDNIVWEENDAAFEAWKEGKTGFPIVDAAMRALKVQGYMHNRCRMIVAMFLTKDLLLDWRLGEKYFMEQLIDGDLASNNGGWQWSASTGTDPQPYFRVFNPTSQSEKSDPSGDYIRYWVPELKKLKGKALHDPSSQFGKKELAKMGYYPPVCDHAKARIRAIARYKNPGSKDNE